MIGDYNNQRVSWIAFSGISESSWKVKYLYSLYWSLVTMLTVGYGDLTPKNELEIIFCLVTMLIGFTMFGLTLGHVTDTIQRINSNKKELKY